MDTIFSRNELYWGKEFQEYLAGLKVAVFGLGGVGGFALEALARAGIGYFLIVDFDTISKSNINRQLIALNSTVGLKKTDVFKKRLLNINPDINVKIYDGFFTESAKNAVFSGDFAIKKYPKTIGAYKYSSDTVPQNKVQQGFLTEPHFIVDAIDTVKSKIELIKFAKENDIKIISSFGAGNRMDASKLYVADISDIRQMNGKDSFTKNVLHKLEKYAGLTSGLMAVSSTEKPHSERKIRNVETVTLENGDTLEFTKFTPASTPIVPAVCGYLMANYIIKIFYENFLSAKSQKSL